jgi:hypothetical protein
MKVTRAGLKSAVAMLAASSLTVLSHAGSDGCQPEDGTYTFVRDTPAPAGVRVATAEFATGTPNGMTLNPGPDEQDWEQESDGQYRPQPHDGRSVCFHESTPIKYEYKYLGDPISTGHLNP